MFRRIETVLWTSWRRKRAWGVAQPLRGALGFLPVSVTLACTAHPGALTLSPICTTFWLGASGQMLADLCCGRLAARQFLAAPGVFPVSS